MTEEEFKAELKKIEEEALNKKLQLYRKYALAHSTYNVGDIFTDHIGSILIEKIKECVVFNTNNLPSCIYFGLELKKDGTPTKKMTKRDAYQVNEVKK